MNPERYRAWNVEAGEPCCAEGHDRTLGEGRGLARSPDGFTRSTICAIGRWPTGTVVAVDCGWPRCDDGCGHGQVPDRSERFPLPTPVELVAKIAAAGWIEDARAVSRILGFPVIAEEQ